MQALRFITFFSRGHGQLTNNVLQTYLDESNYSREDDNESRLELCLLLVHCYEVRDGLG